MEDLRASGLTDREIFDATVFVALRMVFSTVDNALGAEPDLQLAAAAPPAVRAAGVFRAIAGDVGKCLTSRVKLGRTKRLWRRVSAGQRHDQECPRGDLNPHAR